MTTLYYVSIIALLVLVVMEPVLAVPPNDECENAIVLQASNNILTGSTVDASVDALNLCGENLVTSPGVWYLYQTPMDKNTVAHVSTCTNQTNFDTALTIYEGDDCSSLKCVVGRDDDLECDAGTEKHSTVSWQAMAGQRYHVLVHGSQANHTGDFGLIVSETEPLDNNQDTSSSEQRGWRQMVLIATLSTCLVLELV